MPAITRVVGQDKRKDGLFVTVRVTGVGQIDEGGMPKRAKLRALIASGMVPDTLTGVNKTNTIEEMIIDVSDKVSEEKRVPAEVSVDTDEEFERSVDAQVAEGNIEDVKKLLDAITEFGTFAQLEEIRELDTKGVVGLTPIKNTFGKGFVDIVNTAEYTYRITTKYSL